MSDIDDKLQEILRLHVIIAPGIMSEIKQTFADEGYLKPQEFYQRFKDEISKIHPEDLLHGSAVAAARGAAGLSDE